VTEVDALQETLAGEHAALWVYGVLGGQTSKATSPRLYAVVDAGYRAHRGRRDLLVRTIRDLGAEPVAAEVAYALPNPVSNPDQVATAGLVTEQRCAATYADLVARTTGSHRRLGIEALTESAVRQLGLRGSPEIFPGADELADR
jgi:uncharacterized protein DUF4439